MARPAAFPRAPLAPPPDHPSYGAAFNEWFARSMADPLSVRACAGLNFTINDGRTTTIYSRCGPPAMHGIRDICVCVARRIWDPLVTRQTLVCSDCRQWFGWEHARGCEARMGIVPTWEHMRPATLASQPNLDSHAKVPQPTAIV